MSETLTKAREEYLDLCQALRDIKPGDHLLDEKTNIVKGYAWRLYLLCEQQEKRIEELEKRRDVNPDCGGACRGDSHETDRA